jgi:hypothetical protein
MKTKPDKNPSCWTRQSAGGKQNEGRTLGDEERILSDIEQFYTNVKEVARTEANAYILDLAAQYCEDTKYFLQKKDYVTAFGAINYAHGLIDAYRKTKDNHNI